MRYQLAESSYILAQFPTGHTVTITIYKLSDNSVAVNAASMPEIGTTGVFKYQQSLAPVAETEYAWVATDSYDTKVGKILLGGYPDTITASQTSEAASISTINGNVATIQSDEATIKASQSSVSSDISTIKADEATIKGSQTTAAGNISTILSDIVTVLADIAAIELSQSGEESGIGTISGNITTILSDIASILSSQSGEESDIGTIQSDVATIKDDVATIKNDEATIKASQTEEESDIDSILSRVPIIGPGAIVWTYTLTESGNGIADVDVWVTTDVAGTNIIASGKTDQNGQVTFYLDAGVVYVWSAKSGWNFDNPDQEVVSV
jgi:hypothetical protein